MSHVYHRVLLWHKMICQTTGGLALCSAKHRLNREEATRWVEYLRNTADDIEQFLKDGTFILDDKGQRVLGSAPGPQFFDSTVKVDKPSGPRRATRRAT